MLLRWNHWRIFSCFSADLIIGLRKRRRYLLKVGGSDRLNNGRKYSQESGKGKKCIFGGPDTQVSFSVSLFCDFLQGRQKGGRLHG